MVQNEIAIRYDNGWRKATQMIVKGEPDPIGSIGNIFSLFGL